MSDTQSKQFTPGPWHVVTGKHSESTDTYDKGEVWFNINNEDGVIADALHGRCLDVDEEEAAANARLIAAAPELYEALKEVKDAHLKSGNFSVNLHNKIEAALTKAISLTDKQSEK